MFRNFWSFISLADIVCVDGKPAKGMAVSKGPLIIIDADPSPGQAIGDIGRVVASEYYLEIVDIEGARIGPIMAAGFGLGPAPPGAFQPDHPETGPSWAAQGLFPASAGR